MPREEDGRRAGRAAQPRAALPEQPPPASRFWSLARTGKEVFDSLVKAA